jgi:signal peptidase I
VRKFAKFLLWTAIFLGIISGILYLTLFWVWVVPSDDPLMSTSIEPSLSPGDVIVMMHAGKRGYGELVRCVDPDEPRRFVIGRIAAEGGDTLVIDNGRLVVNGKSVSFEYACSKRNFTVKDPTTGSPVDMICHVEELGAVSHKTGVRPGQEGETPITKTVQPGHVFLVSDNRFYPADSRIYGSIPIESCDSRVLFRFWSGAGFSDVENRFTFVY